MEGGKRGGVIGLQKMDQQEEDTFEKREDDRTDEEKDNLRVGRNLVRGMNSTGLGP